MNTSSFFCQNCFSASELIGIANHSGNRTSKCPICASVDCFTIAANDILLRRTFRALIRLHYSEWDYNEHLGGTSLSSLLFGVNSILNLDSTANQELYEDAIAEIESEWYPVEPSMITLGGGYWDGGILWGINRQHSPAIRRLLFRAYSENYFSLIDEVKSVIESFVVDITSSLPLGERFFRARIGVSERGVDYSTLSHKATSNDPRPTYFYSPYQGTQIGSPPPHMCSEGRLNRHRVAVLYMATDIATAVAEVRPHPGHLVSTCSFTSTRALKFADFTTRDVTRFLSDSKLELLRDIITIDSFLNLPLPPDQREPYSITQLLSDSLRELNFDGIMFTSSVGSGKNFVCFNPQYFTDALATSSVIEVTGLSYVFQDKPQIGKDIEKDELMTISSGPLDTLSELLERKY